MANLFPTKFLAAIRSTRTFLYRALALNPVTTLGIPLSGRARSIEFCPHWQKPVVASYSRPTEFGEPRIECIAFREFMAGWA